jgi:hypothetical protein
MLHVSFSIAIYYRFTILFYTLNISGICQPDMSPDLDLRFMIYWLCNFFYLVCMLKSVSALPYNLVSKFRFIWLGSFREDFFRYRPIRNKNCLWWPCLLTDRDEMSILHRGHSIDASYHASVNLAVNFSHFNLLLWNPLAKWTEI